MEKYKRSDIDIYSMERLSVSSREGILYKDGDELYKIFEFLDEDALKIKLDKLIALDKFPVPGGIKTQKLLFRTDGCSKREKMVCYSRKYIEGKTLSEFFKEYKTKDILLALKIVGEVSKTLEMIHNDPRNIVIGDLQFRNILIDEYLKHYFIDLDSCMIEGIPTFCYPSHFGVYAKNRNIKGNLCQYLSKETDKICLILSLFRALFNEHLDNISLYDYDKKTEQINILKNLKEIFLILQNKEIFIPNIPYIHEIADKTYKK